MTLVMATVTPVGLIHAVVPRGRSIRLVVYYVVADCAGSSALGVVERLVVTSGATAQNSLVRAHPDDAPTAHDRVHRDHERLIDG